MKKTVALILIGLTIFLGGCNKEKKSTKDVLHAFVGSDTESLDPAKCSSAHGHMYGQCIYEPLAVLNEKGVPQLAAADKCDISPDGLTYTFHIRDNKWQNGDPVTAKDFEYSWKRTLNPETGSTYAYMLYPIKGAEEYNSGKVAADALGVKALDDRTLQVILKAPTGYFLGICAHQAAFPVNPRTVAAGSDWATKVETLIGNGPFIIKKWVHNNKISMVKNNDYWDKDKVKFNGIEFYLLDSDVTADAMFDNGELDFEVAPNQSRWDLLAKAGKLYEHASIKLTYYALDNGRPPFNNPKVRQAFAKAIDRSKMVKALTRDKFPIAYGIVPYGLINPSTNQDFRQEAGALFSESVGEAKKLLAEAGYKDGKGFPTVTLVYNTREENKKAAELLQEMIRKNLGINIEIHNQEWKVYQDSKQRRVYDISQCFWAGDYFDPMTFLDLVMTNGGNNYGVYSNPEFDRLLQAAQNTGDQKVRMEAMHQAEKILMDDMGVVPILFGKNMAAVQPKLKGFINPGNGSYSFKYAYKE